jgi:hypothetical protein
MESLASSISKGDAREEDAAREDTGYDVVDLCFSFKFSVVLNSLCYSLLSFYRPSFPLSVRLSLATLWM